MKRILMTLIALLLLAGCTPSPTATPLPTATTLPTVTASPTNTTTATATAIPTATITATPTATRTPEPTATATATRMPSFEDLYGGLQKVQVSIDHLGKYLRNDRTVQRGGALGVIDNSDDPIYQLIAKEYGYVDNNVLLATANVQQNDYRVQTFFFSSLPETVIKPPWSFAFPFKLGRDLNIGTGGWLNLLTTFRPGGYFEIIANVDMTSDMRVALNIKYPDGSTYRYYKGRRLEKDRWYLMEAQEMPNGLVTLILHIPVVENDITGTPRLVRWLDSEEASGLNYRADIARLNNGSYDEPGLSDGHAGSLYGVNLSVGSSVMRGPVVIKQLGK